MQEISKINQNNYTYSSEQVYENNSEFDQKEKRGESSTSGYELNDQSSLNDSYMFQQSSQNSQSYSSNNMQDGSDQTDQIFETTPIQKFDDDIKIEDIIEIPQPQITIN